MMPLGEQEDENECEEWHDVMNLACNHKFTHSSFPRVHSATPKHISAWCMTSVDVHDMKL
jgi:hypothetical protein